MDTGLWTLMNPCVPPTGTSSWTRYVITLVDGMASVDSSVLQGCTAEGSGHRVRIETVSSILIQTYITTETRSPP